MTKDIAYMVRVEEGENNYWLAEDEDDICLSFRIEGAKVFYDESSIKDALRQYYSETHKMEERERAFVCKVSVRDCACFVKKDIDILLGKTEGSVEVDKGIDILSGK